MNDERIEELLRTTLERDAAQVPLSRPEWDPALPLQPDHSGSPRQARHRGRSRPLMAAACLLLVVAAGIALFSTESDRDLRVGSPSPESDGTAPTTTAMEMATTTTMVGDTPDTTSSGPPFPASTTTTIIGSSPVTTIAPPVTLPESTAAAGVPETVPGIPITYYRFAPDLDLAWSDPDGQPQLCWRTPTDQRCVDQPGRADSPSTLVIPSSSRHALILVFPARNMNRPNIIDVEVASDDVLAVSVSWPEPQLDIGIARISHPATDITRVSPG